LKLRIYPTDIDWFEFLANRPDIDEVNFWRPGGQVRFTELGIGDLLLFRIRSPINKIAGGGFFLHSSLFPLNAAWDAFGIKNGTSDFKASSGRSRTSKESDRPRRCPPIPKLAALC
jgi:putative restriction endonuclease